MTRFRKKLECPVELNGRVALVFDVNSYQELLMAFQIISTEKDSLKKEKNKIRCLGMGYLGLNL